MTGLLTFCIVPDHLAIFIDGSVVKVGSGEVSDRQTQLVGLE